MTEEGRLPHLRLNKRGSIGRRTVRRGTAYKAAKRDPGQFYRAQRRKLVSIAERYEEEKRDGAKHGLEPRLIFKISLSEPASDARLRNELKGAGIETISSSSNKMGYWVAFSDDAKFTGFLRKLEGRRRSEKTTFVDIISGIGEIPPGEKISESLRKGRPAAGEQDYMDIWIWKMTEGRVERFFDGLSSMIKKGGGEITDRYVSEGSYIVRARCGRGLMWEIAGMRDVERIDRAPHVDIEPMLAADVKSLDVEGAPGKDSQGVLIVDSGLLNHPLIEGAIAGHIDLPSHGGREVRRQNNDDVGHGTLAAGIALYGDVEECLRRGRFSPGILLYSAKVLYKDRKYGDAVFDSKRLLESQIKWALDSVARDHPNCSIANISFGDGGNRMRPGERQLRIASLIDDLAVRHPNMLFTVSAGNNMYYDEESKPYPEYMIGNEKFGIIDPATSAHGITVGSVFPSEPGGAGTRYSPSPFTRTGPGLRGMVKPELVDDGGGSDDSLVSINPKWSDDGRMFTLTKGTSFSAPKIAHYMAKIKQEFPGSSRNFVKALLLSSASIPSQMPGSLGRTPTDGSDTDLQKVLNVYGYGRADLGKALHSDQKRVLLEHQGKIRVDTVDYFPIMVPGGFFREPGRKSIGVSLAFDPPVDRNRNDYMGATVEYMLIKNLPVREAITMIKKAQADAGDNPPKLPQKNVLKMHPGVRLRSKGMHQKSVVKYEGRPRINHELPLILAVTCVGRWLDKGHMQGYSVVVTLEHSAMADLYNAVKVRNASKAMVR